jgi:hypothetical protein
MDLPSLGREGKARIEAGDKAKLRSEDMYRSAGLYLIEAKERVKRTKGITWPEFLLKYCPIGPRRADEIIMLADGRMSLEELRSVKAERERSRHVKTQRHGAETQPNTQRKQRPDILKTTVDDVRKVSDDARSVLLKEIIETLKTYPLERLQLLKEELLHVQ